MSPATLFRTTRPTTLNPFPIQGTAIVERAITPQRPGQVYFQASYWHARCTQANLTLQPGNLVEVIDRDGLTLLVKPLATVNTGRDNCSLAL